jgi:hypothetical protein
VTQPASTTAAASGAGDFDFFMGRWQVRNRRRRQWLAGSEEWYEFDATCEARPILGGLGNMDEFRTGHQGGFTGMSLRLFHPDTGRWSIYWASSRHPGVLDPPVSGAFSGDTGTFEGTDTHAGQPVLVRYRWSGATTATPRWEQAFSADDGQTWETNWVMDFTRA